MAYDKGKGKQKGWNPVGSEGEKKGPGMLELAILSPKGGKGGKGDMKAPSEMAFSEMYEAIIKQDKSRAYEAFKNSVDARIAEQE